MIPEELLSQLQQLTPFEDDFNIAKGISKVDISKPIRLDNLLFNKLHHCYDLTPHGDCPFEIDKTFPMIDVYGYKETYTILGLLFLELLFSKEKHLKFHITQSHSKIKFFYVYLQRAPYTDFDYELKTHTTQRYNSFEYSPREITDYPFSKGIEGNRIDPKTADKPLFLYSQSDDKNKNNPAFQGKEDQLVFLANTNSLLHLANLFLDIGQNQNKINEIRLENPTYGCGGMAEHSIEARFWLPNSFAFFGKERLEDLSF